MCLLSVLSFIVVYRRFVVVISLSIYYSCYHSIVLVSPFSPSSSFQCQCWGMTYSQLSLVIYAYVVPTIRSFVV